MAIRDYLPRFGVRKKDAVASDYRPRRRPSFISAVSSDYIKETRMIAGNVIGGNLGLTNGLDGGAVSKKEMSWPTWPMSADQIVWRFWNILCARSRECANNNDHGRRYMHLVRENVAGAKGLRLKPIPRGPDGKYDEPTADCISEAYEDWCKSPEVTGQHSMVTAQRLMLTSAAQDGEILLKFVYGGDAGDYGFGIQILDPFLLDPHFNSGTKGDGTYIRASIEYNSAGRPTAYHLRRQINDYWGYSTTVQYDRVPASEIIHAFVPELVGQRRGLPWMRTALQRFWHIKGFETASVINARVSAAKLGFFRDPDGETDADPVEMDAEPGVFEDIGTREFIKVDWNWPTGEFDPFLKACLRHAAAGLNVANHSLTGDLSGANYSSLRVASLDEREAWIALQVWFASSVADRVYGKWLEFALLSGIIIGPSGRPLPAENIDVYRRVLWLGRRWAWIDPLKEISANIQAIIHRLKSRTQVIEEQGGDATATWEQIRAEEDELEELDISLPAHSGGQQTPNLTAVGPDANGNDDPDTGEQADPDAARLAELEQDLRMMRSLHTASTAALAERELEIARLKAARPKRKAKAAAAS